MGLPALRRCATNRRIEAKLIQRGSALELWRRLNENWEMFDLLCRNGQEILTRNGWCVGWLRSQEAFLLELSSAEGAFEIWRSDGRGREPNLILLDPRCPGVYPLNKVEEAIVHGKR
jgi:hypothetical protein